YEAGIVLEAVLERLISPKARQLPPGDAVAILHRADLDRRPLPAVVRLDVEQIVAGGTVAAADDVPAPAGLQHRLRHQRLGRHPQPPGGALGDAPDGAHELLRRVEHRPLVADGGSLPGSRCRRNWLGLPRWLAGHGRSTVAGQISLD